MENIGEYIRDPRHEDEVADLGDAIVRPHWSAIIGGYEDSQIITILEVARIALTNEGVRFTIEEMIGEDLEDLGARLDRDMS